MEKPFFPFLSSNLVLQAAIQPSSHPHLAYITINQLIKNSIVHIIAILCRPIMAICRPIMAMCRLIMAMCRFIMAMCRPIMAMCRPIMTMCRTIMAMCRTIMAMCRTIIAMCRPIIAKLSYNPVFILQNSTFKNITVPL